MIQWYNNLNFKFNLLWKPASLDQLINGFNVPRAAGNGF